MPRHLHPYDGVIAFAALAPLAGVVALAAVSAMRGPRKPGKARPGSVPATAGKGGR